MQSFQTIREETLNVCTNLEIEDYVVQPFPFVSPPKWHLGHTTWFFEAFCLQKVLAEKPVDDKLAFIFNSYYESVGARVPQAERGHLSRPTLNEILNYRRNIDSKIAEANTAVGKLSPTTQENWQWALNLGLHHEQQHQELLLMDIKAILAAQTLRPLLKEVKIKPPALLTKKWKQIPEGVYDIGHASGKFAFDNEEPRHRVYVHSFAMCEDLVTAGEFLEFLNDKGYQRSELWLADGWRWLQKSKIKAPLYWSQENGLWYHYTLEQGFAPVDPHHPVQHVSYYEADAFARWKKHRLPTEVEWEVTFSDLQTPHQVWQWTQSAYLPYPGFKPFPEDFAEYNGKFMNGQVVMRGGCAATPENHFRATYRNFFYPENRWQYAGIRLAK